MKGLILLTALLVSALGHSAVGAWIGLSDLVEEDQFMWTTSQQPPSYTNFATRQPDNYEGVQDCVCLTNDPSHWTPGAWDDITCNFEMRFICERHTT